MNPPCHRCHKTVYPTEKLACLDKYWHKGCFNCETCKMTLSMKTYKGYNKLPYCNTHYPTTKFTAVADTPENMRLRKNTQNQSSVIYHKDFEDSKSKYTVVSDDPETLRLKKNTQQTSDIAYQGSKYCLLFCVMCLCSMQTDELLITLIFQEWQCKYGP